MRSYPVGHSVSETMSSTASVETTTQISRAEIRASGLLASILAMRMLGWFLILPVFSVHAAKTLVGGDNATLVGWAMGVYGLMQAFGQLPYGMASDKYGRKPVIVTGLLLFALGSFIAAGATDIHWVIAGRAVQGAGAISAAVTAFIADSTREEHRTKAMAMVGGAIGITCVSRRISVGRSAGEIVSCEVPITSRCTTFSS